MQLKLSNAVGIGGGVALIVLTAVVAWRARDAPGSAEVLALKAHKLDLAAAMSLELSRVSEAEQGAVMSASEADTALFAGEARRASAHVEELCDELEALLAGAGQDTELALLEELSQRLADYRKVGEELLALVAGQTNAKATALLFGPAAEALEGLDQAVRRAQERAVGAQGSATACALLWRAEVAALRLQALLPPHIAESDDARMDELEARMSLESAALRESLAALADVEGLAEEARAISAACARFEELRAEILRLSRANTNVRSLALALGLRRSAALDCEEALHSLTEALDAEEIPGVNYEPINPRRLGAYR